MEIAVQPMGYFAYQKAAYDYMPGLLFRYTLHEQSKYTGLTKGAAFSLGGYYRIQDAFIPTLFIETDSFAFGLSYDLTTSTLSANNYSRGGFEISLRYVNPNPFKPKSQARFY